MDMEQTLAVKKMLDDASILARIKQPPVSQEEEEEASEQAIEDTALFQLRSRIGQLLSTQQEEAQKLLEFVEDNLQCEYGYIQQLPSYSKGDPHVGRMTYFQKGCYENGSVYNHGCAFKLVADCHLGNGNAALKTLMKMMPDNPDNHYDHSGVEPYAFTNMFLGPENEYRAGETVQHWVTGTCGWLFKGVVEYMLGIQADFDGLAIRPVLPDEWTDVKVHRVYRNATYEIEIKNRKKNGTVNISVDGNRIDGDVLPDFNDGKVHNVNVEIV